MFFFFFFRTPMQALISIPSMTVSKIVRYWLVVYFSLFNYVSFMILSPCVELASLVPKFQVTEVRNSMIQFVAYLSKVQLVTSINLNCQVLSLKELRSREKFMSSLAYPYQCKLFPLGANASTILQY